MLTETAIGPGLADPIRDSQTVFRALLDAFARPGHVADLTATVGWPAALPQAAAAVLLSLVDYETPLWLSSDLPDAVRRWLVFHTGAPIVACPEAARFAVCTPRAEAPALTDFNPGEDRYPDKSTTVILPVEALDGGEPAVLTGPGIRHETVIAPRGLPAGFWAQWSRNHACFPLGVDVVLVAGASLIALPRSIAACTTTSGGA